MIFLLENSSCKIKYIILIKAIISNTSNIYILFIDIKYIPLENFIIGKLYYFES